MVMGAIAIVGMTGSGKSLLASYFKQQGLPVIRFGQIVIDEIARRGLIVNERNERMVREEIRCSDGMDVCAKRSLPAIQSALTARGTVVLDGLYSLAEYKTLRSTLRENLVVVAVFTPRDIRYTRLASRSERPLTRTEAEERDMAEVEHIEKGGPIALADYVLLNDGTQEALRDGAELLLKRLR